MGHELIAEKEYINFSFLPNVNPRCRQLVEVLPIVCLDHIGILENVRGLNLNKFYPEHDDEVY